MADAVTPVISREALAALLDFEAEEAAVSYDRETLQMLPQRLDQLLAPERTTADLVILLDRPKRRCPGPPVLLVAFCLAGIAIGALVTSLVI